MSAKLLNAITEDNPDLQKQIGCMTGIFQLFDRHHIINGRRSNGHGHKRLPPGNSKINNGNPQIEPYLQKITERNPNKNMNENRRVSIESSTASFSSSSCSSSFSSLDCNKTAHSESLSFDRLILTETPSRDLPVNQPSASPRTGRQSLDRRDMVKDTIYRGVPGLSIKTRTKEEEVNHVMKHRDSPRPFHLSKSAAEAFGIDNNGKPKVPVDLNESLKVLSKLREAPWNFNEARERSRSSYEARDRDEPFFRAIKDSPRFSYDGREISRSSFESRDTFKGTTKLRESPRLSLDSRESSMRGCNFDSKSNLSFKDLQKSNANSNKKPPSVVAKLMGLEALPGSISVVETSPGDHHDPKKNSISGSPRSSPKDPISPRLRNLELVIKPKSSSKFPIEPAPWKQQERSHDFQKQLLRNLESPSRLSSPYPSVYSEIEKRLKELEFEQSNKDLRALKHILEAMTKKEKDQTSKNPLPQKKYNIPNHTNLNPNPRLANKRTPLNNHPLKTFESPIVIMKPAKLIKKSGIPASSVIPNVGLSGTHKSRSVDSECIKKGGVTTRASKDLILKQSHNVKDNNRILQSVQTKENTVSFGRSSGSVSPRLQQKKLELEKQSRPPSPSSDSSKPRRQSSRQQAESSSPRGKLGPKSPNLQQSNEKLIEISRKTRISSQGDEISSSASQIDIEVTKTDRSAEVKFTLFHQSNRSPSWKATDQSVSSFVQKNRSPRLSEDGSNAELAIVTQEQPSPVSVLDDSFYKDDLPSPVKIISNVFKDHDTQNSDNDLEHLSNCTEPYISYELNHKKLENTEHLVQNFRRLNSNHDEATTDYIALLCEDTKPDNRFISEIMIASGLLLRDHGSGLRTIKLHPSGFPINPDLFFVLEQTKEKKDQEKIGKLKPDQEKLHRKLIFDTVNEILLRKLSSEALLDPWLQSGNLSRRNLNSKELLRELSSEIEQLQSNNSACNFNGDDDDNYGLKNILWEDVMHRSENWMDFHREVPGTVLDVERLIFKDLVDEIVSGESASLRVKPSRRCRQLFNK